MRHRKKVNHLSRKSAHRKAMLANMASSLILHKRIFTTTAKAKALRTYVEPLITKSKTDNTHSRRTVFSYLKDKDAVSELFRDVADKVSDRPGGYTRILKTGNRLGDNAEMCFIELVDYNENMLKDTSQKKSSRSRRRRRGGKKKEGEAQPLGQQEQQAAPETGEENTQTETAEGAAQVGATEEKAAATDQTEVQEAPESAAEEKTETREEPKNQKAEEDKKEAKEDKKEGSQDDTETKEDK